MFKSYSVKSLKEKDAKHTYYKYAIYSTGLIDEFKEENLKATLDDFKFETDFEAELFFKYDTSTGEKMLCKEKNKEECSKIIKKEKRGTGMLCFKLEKSTFFHLFALYRSIKRSNFCQMDGIDTMHTFEIGDDIGVFMSVQTKKVE